MRTRALLTILLFLGSAAVPARVPDPASGTISVRVVYSQLIYVPVTRDGGSLQYQQLDCIIGTQRVRLVSSSHLSAVLAPGTYPGTLKDESRKPKSSGAAYDLNQTYVLLLPDGTRRVYDVVGLGSAETNP